MTEHIVRSGLSFGCIVLAAVSFLWAAVSAAWRWARSRGGRP